MRTAWTKAATTDGMRRRAATRRASIALLAAVLVAVGTAGPLGARPAAAQTASPLDGTATLSGMVTAAEPFAAARVYIRNVDRRILYMVYTQAGRVSRRGALPRHLRGFRPRDRARVRRGAPGAERGRQRQPGPVAAGRGRRPHAGRGGRRRRDAGGARRDGAAALRRAVSAGAGARHRRADLHAVPRRQLPVVAADPPRGVGGGHRQDVRQGDPEPAIALLRRRHHLVPRRAAPLLGSGSRDPAGLSGRALRAGRAAAPHPHRAADAGRRGSPRQGDVHRVLPPGGRARRGRERPGVRRVCPATSSGAASVRTYGSTGTATCG